MRPSPRQKIYKFYIFKNLLHLITLNLFNLNKTKILENHFKKHFSTQNALCINKGRIGAYLAVKACIKPRPYPKIWIGMTKSNTGNTLISFLFNAPNRQMIAPGVKNRRNISNTLQFN